eukprot:8145600-Karenia_brevis.AAC.1
MKIASQDRFTAGLVASSFQIHSVRFCVILLMPSLIQTLAYAVYASCIIRTTPVMLKPTIHTLSSQMPVWRA